ncbi:MAG: aminotransferase class III-fold pyridoxal phosphate-dependent enzyme [Rubripirellula sp.]
MNESEHEQDDDELEYSKSEANELEEEQFVEPALEDAEEFDESAELEEEEDETTEFEDANELEEQEIAELEEDEQHEPEPVAVVEASVYTEHDLPSDGPIEIEQAFRRSMQGSANGIRRADHEGNEILDAMAGRASAFGFGFDPITEAIQAAAENYLGDGSAHLEDAMDDGILKTELDELFVDTPVPTDSVFLCPAADLAVEKAIALARTYRDEQAFRTVALLGSDHGRTGLCRTASGRPELHTGFGPMMAGFAHVPSGDLKALRSVVDDQTACILLSPIDVQDGTRPIDGDFLLEVREICDERGILLVIDETQVGLGASGQPLSYMAIAEVVADIVVLSSGLFGGLAGGVVLASQRVTGEAIVDTSRYPLLSAVAAETLSALKQQDLPASAEESMRLFAVSLAEQLHGFEFVRDVHVLGMTIGIETDMENAAIVRAAARKGVRIEAAGETAVRLQLPIQLSDEDQQSLLERLGETMAAIERETAEMAI